MFSHMELTLCDRWRRSGEDRGEGGYRCRWTVMGGAARDGSWEYKETVRILHA